VSALVWDGCTGLMSSKVDRSQVLGEQLATKNFAQSVLDVGTVVSIGDGNAPSIWM
jgi:hypothetical protein